MANSWFRLYAEFEDDPKIRIMSDAMQIRLVYLMCQKCKGVTVSERHMMFQWRCTEQELSATKAEFLQNGFIDDHWNLLNWNKRQYISDNSTDRTRRYRERKRTSQERHKNKVVTPPDSDTDTESDTDTDTEKKKPSARGTRLPEDFLPSDDHSSLAKDLGVNLHVEFEKFGDYWRAQPGAKGRKLDWDATLRNWIRTAAERKGTKPNNGYSPNMFTVEARPNRYKSLDELEAQ